MFATKRIINISHQLSMADLKSIKFIYFTLLVENLH